MAEQQVIKEWMMCHKQISPNIPSTSHILYYVTTCKNAWSERLYNYTKTNNIIYDHGYEKKFGIQ